MLRRTFTPLSVIAAPMYVTEFAHLNHHRHGTSAHALRGTATIYAVALLALATAVLIRHLLTPWIGATLPFVTMFGAIAVAAAVGGYRPAVLVSVLGYLCSAWMLLPGHAIHVDAVELGGWPGLMAYVLTCAVVVGVAEAARGGRTLPRFNDAARADRDASVALRSALRNIGDAVVTADSHGCVTTMNPAAELLTGWHEREAVGEPLDAVVHLVDALTRQPIGSPAALGLQEDGVIVGVAGRTVLVSRHGSEHSVEECTTAIRDAAGRRVGVVMILSEATEPHGGQRESRRRPLGP
jgi:PAS domain S-box-containing protein